MFTNHLLRYVISRTFAHFPSHRLIHCLLLGHVPSLPSLGDLCSMREAFRTKPSSASRLSTGVPARPSSATPTAGAKAAKGHDAQELSNLRFAQRYLPSVRFWFEKEKETKEEGEHRKGGGSGGSKGSSAIKAVYSEAWVGDDGRLDGLDLLLTLCAVPADSSSPVAVPVVDDKEEGRGNDGKRRGDLSARGKNKYTAVLNMENNIGMVTGNQRNHNTPAWPDGRHGMVVGNPVFHGCQHIMISGRITIVVKEPLDANLTGARFLPSDGTFVSPCPVTQEFHFPPDFSGLSPC